MPIIDPDLLHVRISHFGRSSLWPWWKLSIHTSQWVIWHNDRDGASFRVGNRVWPLRGGRTMVLPPDLQLVTSPGPDIHQVYLHVELIGFPPEAIRALAPGPVDLGDDPICAAQASALHAALGDVRTGSRPGEQNPIVSLAARAFVFQALTRLITMASSATQESLTTRLRNVGPLNPAIRYIDEHLGEPLYIAALAKLCGMGPQWFTRQLRRATSLAPARYILDRRVAIAAQLLAYADDPIEQIADRCGFTDRAHFTRVFTRLRKAPPARFRRDERRRLGHD